MAARNTMQPPARTLRLFGWLLAGGLALTGHFIGPSPAALFLQLGGAGVFAIGTVRPSALRPPYRVLAALTSPLGRLWSRLSGSAVTDGDGSAALRPPRRLR